MADLWDNPMQTDGFEFVEYAAPDPKAMAAVPKLMNGLPKLPARPKTMM